MFLIVAVVVQSCPTLCDRMDCSMEARLPCSSPSPGACSNSSQLSRCCHPTISFSVAPFSCLQSFLASGSFLMSWLLPSSGQNIGDLSSTSVLPMNI